MKRIEHKKWSVQVMLYFEGQCYLSDVYRIVNAKLQDWWPEGVVDSSFDIIGVEPVFEEDESVEEG